MFDVLFLEPSLFLYFNLIKGKIQLLTILALYHKRENTIMLFKYFTRNTPHLALFFLEQADVVLFAMNNI